MKRLPASVVGVILAALSLRYALAQSSDLIPPTAPSGLAAALASCGQVTLEWKAAADEAGGSGLKAYIIRRTEGSAVTEIAIGANRTAFSDTNYLKASATLGYAIFAQDFAGNRSAPSNSETVATPPCPSLAPRQIVDDASIQPLGKSIASFGSRTVLIYAKQNSKLTLDTWAYVRDVDTGETSRFLLHGHPGYRQIETDYVLTSSTELWTLSSEPWGGGRVLASQYRLNGSTIPTSATLLSTRSLGDSGSFAKSLIRLKSGALMFAWNQDRLIKPDGSVDAGFAYRSPAGAWTPGFRVAVPSINGGNNPMSQITLAQHPADDSVWAFLKRDAFDDIAAFHFTESPGGIALDWLRADYISCLADGGNCPQTEFPFISALADPVRNAILLAYQTSQERIVFIDPLLNDMNMIFLKEAKATIAQIRADGTKTFIPFPTYMERGVQFGFSALADGALWLAYQPIRHSTLTWNEVYASRYFNGGWSAPALIGFNYNNYNVASAQRDPGFIAYRTDQAEIAFRFPDQRIHLVSLSSSSPPPPTPDTAAPSTSISSPVNGATVSGALAVTADAADNVGVARVDLLIDGTVKASKSTAPFEFFWDTQTAAPGLHQLQTTAYDAAGNTGSSPTVTVAVADATAPVVVITAPATGTTIRRNSQVTFAATATDNVRVVRVEFYAGTQFLGSDTTSPYAAAWSVPARKNARYTLRAVAYDEAGNSASATSTVTAK